MQESAERDPVISHGSVAQRRGCHEIAFPSASVDGPELPLLVAYTLPSGAIKSSRGFSTGDGQMKTRCYVNEEGLWSWEAKNLEGRCIETGSFSVVNSPLPGKLRISSSDPRQLQYDIGRWYLNFGDNAYRFLSLEESRWKAYIDQAAQAGFNRIRTWLCQSPASLFQTDRKRLDLSVWDKIDERLAYGLQRHPEIQFEIILFGPDPEELQRFGEGELGTHSAFRYAIERFGPLPNVHWPIASGYSESDPETNGALSMIGESLTENDPWNSLVTFTGKRFDPLAFGDRKWVSFQSISSLGQVTGEALSAARASAQKPVALSEDRGEHQYAPRFARYYFRRLFWSALLSGALPSYTGLISSEAYDRNKRRIEGYYDACNSGRLKFGAHDLLPIKKFFSDTEAILENWSPNDALSGNNPLLVKSMLSEDSSKCIAYVANPETFAAHSPDGYDGMHSDQISDASETFTTVTLELPFSSGTAKWYNPNTGEWKGEAEITKNSTTLLTPEPGDWVVWVERA